MSNDSDKILKEAALIVKRLADFESGKTKSCIHCGKQAMDTLQVGRCVYIEVEQWRDCPAFQASKDAIKKIAEYDGKWICRQYQGSLPHWAVPDDTDACEQLSLFDGE